MALEQKVLEVLASEIDESIWEIGNGYGPSLIGLYLHGPSGIMVPDEEKKLIIPIDDYSINVLLEREKIIDEVYKKQISPKICSIVSSLTDGRGSFPDKCRMNAFKVRPFEDVRKILKDNFKWQFDLDSDTGRELFSTDSMNITNNYVRIYHDKGNNYLYFMRQKQNSNSRSKYDLQYDKLKTDNQDIFPYFLERISKDEFYFWDEEHYKKYKEVYGEDIVRMMLGDYMGVKIVDLNQDRAKKRLEDLSKIGVEIKIPGFKVVPDRFDNHIDRLKENRPGGIHYTLVDKGLSNFPIEIQFLDFESMVRDMFGPNKHYLYTQRGKKSSDKYQ